MKPSKPQDGDERRARKAVALHYETDADAAPRLVAKGDRLLAERIIEIARQNNIPVHEDAGLVAILSVLDLDREIPEQLYRAVAEVLAFVYSVSRESGR